MAQQLRALTACPEDLGSIPRTHMAAHSCLYMVLVLEAPRPLLGFVDTQKARGTSLYIRENTHAHDKNNKRLESIVEESYFFPLA